MKQANLGERAEQYAHWLEQRVAWSTISNYLSALIQCTLFVISAAEEDVPSATAYDSLCNLRRQSDKLANEAGFVL
jgi:hypothetical protein